MKVNLRKLNVPPLKTIFYLGTALLCLSGMSGKAQDTLPIRRLVSELYHPDSFFIGTACHERYLGTATETILDREFSYVTPANDFKQSYIHPQPGTWQWERSDTWVKHCRENNQVIRLHAPISPQCSKWVKNDARTAAELDQMLEEYVTGLCQRYSDCTHIKWLDVVNETISTNGSWFGPKPGDDKWENPWTQIGFDESADLRPPLYIKKAFELAMQHGPGLKLIINQHGAFEEVVWDKMKNLVAYLRDQGIRVDGIGWQAHLWMGWEKEPGNLERLAAFIDWCHSNELEFHITEFNVWLGGADQLKYREQANTFYEIVRTTISRHTTGTIGINFWHIRGVETSKKERDGCLWTTAYEPKVAYYDVKQALLEVAQKTGPQILSTPPRSAIINQPYTYRLETRGEVGTPRYTLETDSLSGQLTINQYGIVSGLFQETDTLDIRVRVADEVGLRMQEYRLIVYKEALSINPVPEQNITVGKPYEYQLKHTGEGTFFLQAGTGLDWLTLDQSGLLSGTPDEEGSFEVTVGLARNQDTALQAFIMNVSEPLKITSAPLDRAVIGIEYYYQMSYNGSGTFSLDTDPAADWLRINQTGRLRGTPTDTGTVHVVITVSNSDTTLTQEYDLYVDQALAFTSEPVTEAVPGEMFRYQVTHEGTGTLTLVSTDTASWLSLDQEGLLSGIPPAADTLQINLKLSNSEETTYQVFNLYVQYPAFTAPQQKQSVLFYPNPATVKIHIINHIPGDRSFLYDLQGRLILQSKSAIIPLQGISPGSYLLKSAGRSALIIVN